MRSVLGLITVAVFGLAACSNVPSGGDAKRALEAQLKADLHGTPFHIDHFEKTNGEEVSGWGVPGYVVSYRATLSFPEGLRPECTAPGSSARMDCFSAGIFGLPAQPVGARPTYESKIFFRKTEKGWVAGGQ
jgi:hypothetical protein